MKKWIICTLVFLVGCAGGATHLPSFPDEEEKLDITEVTGKVVDITNQYIELETVINEETTTVRILNVEEHCHIDDEVDIYLDDRKITKSDPCYGYAENTIVHCEHSLTITVDGQDYCDTGIIMTGAKCGTMDGSAVCSDGQEYEFQYGPFEGCYTVPMEGVDKVFANQDALEDLAIYYHGMEAFHMEDEDCFYQLCGWSRDDENCSDIQAFYESGAYAINGAEYEDGILTFVLSDGKEVSCQKGETENCFATEEDGKICLWSVEDHHIQRVENHDNKKEEHHSGEHH